jgi:hypothetical protein
MTPRPILAGAAVVLALIAGAIWVILKVLLIGMPPVDRARSALRIGAGVAVNRVNWVKVGYAMWTIAFIESWVIVFWPSIRLWAASH